MKCNRRAFICTLGASAFAYPAHRLISQPVRDHSQHKEKDDDDKPVDSARLHNSVLWHDPGLAAALDLLNGQGGKDGQPVPPFRFESEDLHGTNPKFDVHDAHGTKWRVKLGDEARPEVVASRLLWATGYFVNDDYVLGSAHVDDLHITRGAAHASDGQIVDARFEKKPEGQKKIGIWSWYKNPFIGTKQFNGLRVMMAVMNNWDLKDVNNAVYEDKDSGRDTLLVSDLGACFGTNGLSYSKSRSKGDVDTFAKSKFIIRKTDREVDFGTPAAPNAILAPKVKQYQMRRDLEWIGQQIPIADARWIGSLLKQLTHQQLVDAFRAGQFQPDEIEKYVDVIERRINELAAL
ncbi:MAG TPA: hypothetical protein VGF82_11915 [Terracidiphilus sp.]|jgi:hypothetical protein